MDLFRRGKQSWVDQFLLSVSLPPFPLVAILAIISLLLFLSSYANYNTQVHQTVFTLKVLLFFLPVLLIFVARFISKYERVVFPYARTKRDLAYRSARDLPWGMLLLLVLLLLMVSYQSYFHAMWSPNLWRSYHL